MLGIIGFLLTIAILVVVHELGHYWIARLCGLPVIAFSFGFGKVLYRRIDKQGCEWRISAIPAGGYVKFLTEEIGPDDEPALKRFTETQRKLTFESLRVAKRSAIVAAGPAMNLVFAVLVYAALALGGTMEIAPTIDMPAKGTPAAYYGLEKGDKITSIDGLQIRSFTEFAEAVHGHDTTPSCRVGFTQVSGRTLELDFQLEAEPKKRLHAMGLTPNIASLLVTKVVSGSAAEAAGLQPGDTILACDGKQSLTSAGFIAAIRATQAKRAVELRLQDATGVERFVRLMPRNVVQSDGSSIVQIGASIASIPELVEVSQTPWSAVGIGFRNVSRFIVMSLKGFYDAFFGDASITSISGPVGIGAMAGKTLSAGWSTFMNFLAIISISLAVLNLLPIPVLDGGHLLFLAYEAVTGNRPVQKARDYATRLGFSLLVALMALALFNDFVGLFGVH